MSRSRRTKWTMTGASWLILAVGLYAGPAAADAAGAATTVILVRHAEKDRQDPSLDPPLTEAGHRRAKALAAMLERVDLSAVFTTGYRRTDDTAQPVAESHKLTPIVDGKSSPQQLAGRIKEQYAGKTVLMVGHSNTVPEIIEALGVETPVAIADDAYDHFFIVNICESKPTLLDLRYGPDLGASKASSDPQKTADDSAR